MSGRGDQRLGAALLARLRAGDADVLDLVAAARQALGSTLVGHEGAVHALLHRLVRRGLVAPQGASARGLTLYGVGGPAGGTVAGPTPRAQALEVAQGVREPAARARVAADLEAHLADLAARGRPGDLGPARPLRALLRRADRRQLAVFLPEGVGGHVLRFLLHEGPWIVGALALYLLLNAFVVKVFVIPSASMLPTLQHGDRVVVRLARGGWTPERWQIVTYQRPGQDGPHTTYVKRAVGLPGEEIALWRGDVYVDGRLARKPASMSALVRRRVKSWEFQAPEGRTGWMVAAREGGGEGWSLAERFFTGSFEVERRFELQDVYVELDVDLGAGGAVTLGLQRGREQLERVAFALHAEAGRGARLERDDSGGRDVLASQGPPLSGRQTLCLSLVDGCLAARLGAFTWQRQISVPAEAAAVSFVLEGGARALALRLDQDLHYSLDGVHAVAQDASAKGPRAVGHKVGPEALFCLGDNTGDSRDSRFQDVGDVPLSQLVGPVVWRLWPPARFGKPR